ncbi:helix-turn-helix domain-containing protein [Curtobacterium sp. 458]|uniref:helix-turn-helix domain-containing protein n=1 Tax=Curtobacterium sp. 458 TaxID=3050069 RepID=UPI0025B58EFA|nr:helix-turn-helix domain-containing protein [Curtobacterium sp. 458]WJY00880.1 helix-turn-helix domain-containing protein [Curtobacterium sp. 458]
MASLGYDPVRITPVVQRALQFMDERHGCVLEVADVANAVGMGPRRLQELFQIAVGESPMSVLRRIRLLHTRRQLLDSGEERTVGQIARAAQLVHLGRFSGHYAAAFGEAPSATIARVRGTAHHHAGERFPHRFDVHRMEAHWPSPRPPAE